MSATGLVPPTSYRVVDLAIDFFASSSKRINFWRIQFKVVAASRSVNEWMNEWMNDEMV